MTGYESKKKAAQDKLDSMERKALKLALKVLEDLPGYRADVDNAITAIKEVLAQPAQEPVATLAVREHAPVGKVAYVLEVNLPVGIHKLYTTPPQRTWVKPTGNEWFEWWRISKVADATEAEIDFADFLIIAQAVSAKLKEENK